MSGLTRKGVLKLTFVLPKERSGRCSIRLDSFDDSLWRTKDLGQMAGLARLDGACYAGRGLGWAGLGRIYRFAGGP